MGNDEELRTPAAAAASAASCHRDSSSGSASIVVLLSMASSHGPPVMYCAASTTLSWSLVAGRDERERGLDRASETDGDADAALDVGCYLLRPGEQPALEAVVTGPEEVQQCLSLWYRFQDRPFSLVRTGSVYPLAAALSRLGGWHGSCDRSMCLPISRHCVSVWPWQSCCSAMCRWSGVRRRGMNGLNGCAADPAFGVRADPQCQVDA
jgi:hypothetical protein